MVALTQLYRLTRQLLGPFLRRWRAVQREARRQRVLARARQRTGRGVRGVATRGVTTYATGARKAPAPRSRPQM